MKEPVLILQTNQPGAVVEVAPGERYGLSDLIARAVAPSELKAPRYALCRMVRLGNGDYRPVPVEWSTWVPCNDELVEKIGVKLSRQTLHRLWRNGYVEMRQVSPSIVELNLESLVGHLQAVHNDPEFWAKPANDGTQRTRRAAYATEIY